MQQAVLVVEQLHGGHIVSPMDAPARPRLESSVPRLHSFAPRKDRPSDRNNQPQISAAAADFDIAPELRRRAKTGPHREQCALTKEHGGQAHAHRGRWINARRPTQGDPCRKMSDDERVQPIHGRDFLRRIRRGRHRGLASASNIMRGARFVTLGGIRTRLTRRGRFAWSVPKLSSRDE